ncbi:hypothetical protein S245_004704, partial [Arachis hypogaea]
MLVDHPTFCTQNKRATKLRYIPFSPKHFVAYYALPRLWVPSIALYRLSSRVGDKRTRTADIRHRVNHRLSYME